MVTPQNVPPASHWLVRVSAWSEARAERLRRSALALPLATLAAVVVVALNEASHDRSVQALARLEQRASASMQMQSVLRRTLDAETALRGYLLTSRRSYLEPYEHATGDIRNSLRWLRRHFYEDAASSGLLAVLEEQTELKLAVLAQTLRAFDDQETEAWVGLLDDGRQNMLQMREVSERLMARERGHVAHERGEVFETLRTSRLGVSATSAAGLLALLLLLRQISSLDEAQRRHALALLAEHQRLEAEVQRRTEDLTELARHLQTVREDESSRLAQELHSELGALLTAARLDVARLRRVLGGASAETEGRLQHLDDILLSGIALKRRIIEDLRPLSLSNLGLVGALQVQLREFAECSGVAVDTDLHPVPLSETAQITVYRLVQEALTNIGKYAQANHVHVRLWAEDGLARVSVVDDGRGFDPTTQRSGAHGLMGMRYRVEGVGGRLSLHTAPGDGTRIEVELPLPADGTEPAEPELT